MNMEEAEEIQAVSEFLRTEACFSVRSLSLGRWKPYSKISKDRSLLLGLIPITEQMETLFEKSLRTEACFLVLSLSSSGWKPYSKISKDGSLFLGSIPITEQEGTLFNTF